MSSQHTLPYQANIPYHVKPIYPTMSNQHTPQRQASIPYHVKPTYPTMSSQHTLPCQTNIPYHVKPAYITMSNQSYLTMSNMPHPTMSNQVVSNNVDGATPLYHARRLSTTSASTNTGTSGRPLTVPWMTT